MFRPALRPVTRPAHLLAPALLLILLLSLLGQPLHAQQDSRLQRLDTGDESRGWEAVGRLDIDGKGFCTGALVADDLVLTAAHCLYDRHTGTRIDPTKIEFRAGWRNGRAEAYRNVRRAVVHPEYRYGASVSTKRVQDDVALLELEMPIRNTTVIPFETEPTARAGTRIGVVSYAHDRAEAPALQEICSVMARQEGILILSCDVDFGSSGAPVFSIEEGKPRIVSVISAKAEVEGRPVALGMQLDAPLAALKAELSAGKGVFLGPAPRQSRVVVGGQRNDTGAKFIRAGN